MPLFDSISSLSRTSKSALIDSPHTNDVAIASGQIGANFLHKLIQKAVEGIKRATSPKGSKSPAPSGGPFGGLLGSIVGKVRGVANKIGSKVRSLSGKIRKSISKKGGIGGILKGIGSKISKSPIGGLFSKIGRSISGGGGGGGGGFGLPGLLGGLGSKIGSAVRSVKSSIGNVMRGRPTGAADNIFNRVMSKIRTNGSLSQPAACPSCPPCAAAPTDPVSILRRERDQALATMQKTSQSMEKYTGKCVKKIITSASKSHAKISAMYKKFTNSPMASNPTRMTKKVMSALGKTMSAVKHTLPHGEVRTRFHEVVNSVQKYVKALSASVQRCRSRSRAGIMQRLSQAVGIDSRVTESYYGAEEDEDDHEEVQRPQIMIGRGRGAAARRTPPRGSLPVAQLEGNFLQLLKDEEVEDDEDDDEEEQRPQPQRRTNSRPASRPASRRPAARPAAGRQQQAGRSDAYFERVLAGLEKEIEELEEEENEEEEEETATSNHSASRSQQRAGSAAARRPASRPAAARRPAARPTSRPASRSASRPAARRQQPPQDEDSKIVTYFDRLLSGIQKDIKEKEEELDEQDEEETATRSQRAGSAARRQQSSSGARRQQSSSGARRGRSISRNRSTSRSKSAKKQSASTSRGASAGAGSNKSAGGKKKTTASPKSGKKANKPAKKAAPKQQASEAYGISAHTEDAPYNTDGDDGEDDDGADE